MSRITMIKTRVGEIETYQVGAGDHLVLCLHGFPEHAVTWYGQINRLTERGYTVWAPNLRGYGQSTRPKNREAYRIDELLKDIADLVTKWGENPVTIMGHDWGALLGWFFAIKFPGHLTRFISIGANHPASLYPFRNMGQLSRSKYIPLLMIPGLAEWSLGSPERLWSKTYQHLLSASASVDERVLRFFAQEHARPAAIHAMANYYRANVNPTWWQQQPLNTVINIPVLSINGSNDPFIDLAAVQRVQHLVPQQKIITASNASHWPHIEDRHNVNNLLMNWLESTS